MSESHVYDCECRVGRGVGLGCRKCLPRLRREGRQPLAATIPTPCVHLGPATGALADCPSCSGKVSLKVFSCEVHGTCTLGRRAEGHACCQGCPDREVPGGEAPASRAWSMLLTGGIGDTFAVESLLTPEERESLETVYYACPSSAEIVQLWQALEGTPWYPRLRHHITLPTGQTTCYSEADVRRACPDLPAGVEDFSIGRAFGQKRGYTGSTWLAPAPDVSSRWRYKPPYVVVVPGSDWGQSYGRFFDDADWRVCLDTLTRHDLVGAVVRRDRHPIPEHPRLHDFQGKLGILEAVEFLAASQGYLGIDSCLSVLAAKLFPASRLSVKSVSDHLTRHRRIYYAPRTEFGFVARRLKEPSWE